MMFKGLVNLTTEENAVIQDYIDKKIEAALEDIRSEIKDLKASKITKNDAVTKNDIGNLLNRVKGRY
ncbi:MAG: hypothetical protein WBI07_13430 [Mobilitalea sp.]